MSVEPLLSGQILGVLLEQERVEPRGYDSRMTWGGPRHNTGEHHGHDNADQDDFAHLTVPLINAAVSCLSHPYGDLRSKSGSFAILAAILLASSFVSKA